MMSGRGSGPTTDRYRKSGCGFLREISVEAPPHGPSRSANKKIAPQAQSKSLPDGALIEIRNAPATVSGFEDAARAKDGRRSISHLRRQVARHFHPSANFTNFRGRPCHGVVSFCGSASSSFSREPGAQCKLSRRSNNRQTLAFPVDRGIFTTPPCPGGIADRRWSSSNRAFGKGSPIVDLWWKAVASTGEIHSYWHI